MSRQLHVVVYHYVRDAARCRFPKLNGVSPAHLRDQLTQLTARYEIATLESALAFVRGTYRPARDLALLTFDDGLKEHYVEVLPMFVQHRVQGVFAVTTGCVEGRVASVHKNHLLIATLDFSEYRDAVIRAAEACAPGSTRLVDRAEVARIYRWDTPEVGAVKYLVNYGLPETTRDRVLDDLFAQYLGDEREFSREWYMSWEETRELQQHGMVIGGHAHGHVPLGTLDEDRQRHEIERCALVLKKTLHPQSVWPFIYPYGSYGARTAGLLREAGFDCAFTVEAGSNSANHDPFALRRFDTNDVTSALLEPLVAPHVGRESWR